MLAQGFKRVWRFLVRIDVAAVLIAVVLLTAALGSCFPHLAPATAADAGRLAQWEAGLRARYGALAEGLAAAGAFRWFHSPLFLVPLAALAVATLACTLDRWPRVWRRVFRQPVRCSDDVFDAAPHTAGLGAQGDALSLARSVRERLERRDFRVRSESADGLVYLRGDRNPWAPLATLVNHLAVLLLLLGAVLSSGCGWREELTIAPGGTAQVGRGEGLALRNEGFAIARYPDGSVAAYEAQVAVVERNREAARRRVRVNEPLIYGGVGMYLQGYQEAAGGYNVTLLAVYDPGYGLVVLAGFMLLLGLVVIFNFPRGCIRARIEPGGALRLAGEADKHAWNFESEFAAFVQELEAAPC